MVKFLKRDVWWLLNADQTSNALTADVVQFHSVRMVSLLVGDALKCVGVRWDRLAWKAFVVHFQSVPMVSLLSESALGPLTVEELEWNATTVPAVPFQRARTMLCLLKDVLPVATIAAQLVKLVWTEVAVISLLVQPEVTPSLCVLESVEVDTNVWIVVAAPSQDVPVAWCQSRDVQWESDVLQEM